MSKNDDLLLAALSTYGEREKAGPERNSYIGGIIDRWFRKGAGDNETAWCAIWMSEIAAQCGFTPPAFPFRVKSWAKMGHEVLTPEPGTVAVLKRGRGRYHVALVVREADDGTLWCIGGNQNNAVSIQGYRASDVYSLRRLG